MKRKDNVTLLDIAKAARLVLSFIEGMDQDEFLNDVKTRSAVLYQILVMGEAVKRLSPEFRSQHTHIPWKRMAGMRDYLIHAYDVVDWEEVWKTATEDIPRLLEDLKSLLPSKK